MQIQQRRMKISTVLGPDAECTLTTSFHKDVEEWGKVS